MAERKQLRQLFALICIVVMLFANAQFALAGASPITTSASVLTSPLLINQPISIRVSASDLDDNVNSLKLARIELGSQTEQQYYYGCSSGSCTHDFVIYHNTPGTYEYTAFGRNAINQISATSFTITVSEAASIDSFTVKAKAYDLTTTASINPFTFNVFNENENYITGTTGNPEAAVYNIDSNAVLNLEYLADGYERDGDMAYFDADLSTCSGSSCSVSSNGYSTDCTFITANSRWTCTVDNIGGGTFDYQYKKEGSQDVIYLYNNMLEEAAALPPAIVGFPDSITIHEGSYSDFYLLDNYVIDEDTSFAYLDWSISYDSQIGYNLDSEKVRFYAKNSDYHGTRTLTLTVEDPEGGEDTHDVDIVVENINDAPVLAPLSDVEIDENETATFTVSATDSDLDDLTYSYISGLTLTEGSLNTYSYTSTYDDVTTGAYEEYQVEFKVEDGNGGEDTETVTIKINHVNRAPTLDSVEITPLSPVLDETLTCSYTGLNDEDVQDTPVVQYEWRLNDAMFLSGESASTLDLSLIDEVIGDEITCIATPNDGTIDGESKQATVTVVDASSPIIHSIDVTQPAYIGNTLTFSATVTDDISVSEVTFTINSIAYSSELTQVGQLYTLQLSAESIGVGTFNFRVDAEDNSGNAATPQDMNFTIENEQVIPVIQEVLAVPSSVVQGNDVQLRARVTDNDAVSSVEVTFNGITLGMSSIGGDWYQATISTTTLAPNTYTFTVNAEDNVGNAAVPMDGTFDVTILDTEAPVIEETNATPNPVTQGDDVTLSARVTDNVAVSTVTTTISGITLNAFPAGGDWYEVTISTLVLPLGTNLFSFNAVDNEGNVATTIVDSFTIVEEDTTGPSISNITVTPNPVTEGNIVTITVVVDDISGVDEVVLTYGTTDVTMTNTGGNTYSVEIDTTGFAAAEYTFTIAATDNEANINTADSSFTVEDADTEAPVIEETDAVPNPVTIGDEVTLSARVTDNVAVTSVTFILNGIPFTMAAVGGDWYEANIDTGALSLGTHNFTVNAIDAEDNNAVPVNDTFEVTDVPDTEDPTIEDITLTPNPVTQGENVTVLVKASDNTGVDTVTAEIDGVEYNLPLNAAGHYVVDVDSSSLAPGNYTVTITVTDAAGNSVVDTSNTLEVLPGIVVDAEAPVIEEVEATPNIVTQGDSIAIGAKVTDNIAVTYVLFTLDGVSLEMSSVGGDWYQATIGTATLAPGSHTFTINANDAEGNNALPVNGTFTVEEDVDSEAPVFIDTTIPTNTINLGDGFTLEAEVTDNVAVDDVRVSFGVGSINMPNLGGDDYGAGLNSSSLGVGIFSVQMTAEDTSGNIAYEYAGLISIIDNSTNSSDDHEAPLITITSPVQDATYNYTDILVSISATDNVGVSYIRYSVNGAPFVPYTSITTESFVDMQENTLEVVANDVAGNVAYAQITFLVNTSSNNENGTDDSFPVATLITTPESGEAPLNVAFNCFVNGGDSSYDFEMNYNDSTASDMVNNTLTTLQGFLHQYTLAGDYGAACIVSDDDGDYSIATANIHVTAPPQVNHSPVIEMVGASPNPVTEGTDVNLQATVTDVDGDMNLVQFEFQGTFYNNVYDGDDNYEFDLPTTGLAPGVYYFNVGAEDLAFLTDGPVQGNFTVIGNIINDTEAPVFNFVDYPTQIELGHPATFRANITDNVAVNDARLEAYNTWAMPNVGSDWYETTQIIPVPSPGLYSFWMAAQDTSGNLGFEYLSPINFTNSSVDPNEDNEAPTIKIYSPKNNATYNYTNIKVSIDAQDNAGIASLEYSIDGTLPQAYPGVFYYNFTDMQTHTLRVIAIDIAGNTAIVEISFDVNTSANYTEGVDHFPAATLTANVTEGTEPLDVLFTCATTDGDADFNYHLSFGNGQAPEDVTTNATSAEFTSTYNQGVYTAVCKLTDVDGDYSQASINLNVTEDPNTNHSPSIDAVGSSPLGVVTGNNVTLQASVSDLDNDMNTVFFEFEGINYTDLYNGDNNYEFNLPTTGLAPGLYYFNVYAEDLGLLTAGPVMGSFLVINLTPINHPPVINGAFAVAPTTETLFANVDFYADVSDVDNNMGSVTFEFEGINMTDLYNGDNAYSAGVIIANLTAGTYYFNVYAEDLTFLTDGPVQGNFTVLPAPSTNNSPVIESVNSPSVLEGDVAELIANVTDLDNNMGTVTFTLFNTTSEIVLFNGDTLYNFNVPTTGLAPGVYAFNVYAEDTASLSDGPVSSNFTVVFNPALNHSPSIDMVGASPNPVTEGNNVTLQATVSDLDGDMNNTYFEFQGANYTNTYDGDDNYEFNLPTTGLAAGTYYFNVYAEDLAFLTDGPTQGSFTVLTSPLNDTVPPTIWDVDYLQNYELGTLMTFTANVTDDGGVANVVLITSLGETTLVPLGNDLFQATLNSSLFGAGLFQFSVRATDVAGNEQLEFLNTINISNSSVNPNTDNEAPQITLFSPIDGALYNYTDILVQMQATDNVGVNTLQYSINSGAFQDYIGAITETFVDLQTNTLHVVAEDLAGNTASVYISFDVNTTNNNTNGTTDLFPQISISANVTEGQEPLDVTFTCTVNSGNPGYHYGIDFGNGLPGQGAVTTNTSVTFSTTYNAAGLYTAMCEVTDVDTDYSSAQMQINVSADPNLNHSPSIDAVGASPTTVTAGDNVTLQATVSDLDGDMNNTYFEFQGANYTNTYDGDDNYEFNLPTTGLAPGTYYFNVYAEDLAFLTDGPAQGSFTILTAPSTNNSPVIESVNSPSVLEGDVAELIANVTDLDNNMGTVTFTLFNTTSEIVLFNGDTLYNFNVPTTGLAPGVYAFNVYAEDAASLSDGPVSSNFTVVFNPALNHSPSIDAVGASPSTVVAGDNVTLQASVSDLDNDMGTVFFEFEGTNYTDLYNGDNSYEYNLPTTGLAAGVYYFNVYAEDLAFLADGPVQGSFTVTNTSVNDTTPIVNLTGTPTTGLRELSVSFTCDVTEGETPYAYNMAFGDGNFETRSTNSTSEIFAHNYTTGDYTSTCTVTDVDGDSDVDTLNINVTPNTVPIADAGLDQTINVSTVATLNGSNSSDADNDTLTFAWIQVSGPENVTLDNSSAAITTFTPTTPGVFVFELNVSDGYNSSTDQVTINVGDINGVVGGYVLDENNVGVANAIVEIKLNNYTVDSTFTDATGMYSLNVTAGTYSLRALKPGYSIATESATIIQEQTIEVNLTIESNNGGFIGETKEIDDSAEEDVNVSVDLTSMFDLSDSNGDYYIGNVPVSSYNLSAEKTGFLPQQSTGHSIVDDQNTTVDFAMSEPGTVSGTIYDYFNYPNTVANATITVTQDGVVINITTANTAGVYS
ncbi:hypothetical protein HOB85_02225, partial [Candidatus Woesearchaeota archaeon]|nr:hypothetical protein [Candidatus Woesearchaeota archaeon]